MTTNATYQVSLARLGQLPRRTWQQDISIIWEIRVVCAIARRWVGASASERPAVLAELREAFKGYAARHYEGDEERAMEDLKRSCPVAVGALTGEEKERVLLLLCKAARRLALWPTPAGPARQPLIDEFGRAFKDYAVEFHGNDVAAAASEVTARCPEAGALLLGPPPVPPPLPAVAPPVPPAPPPPGLPPAPPACPPGYRLVKHATGDVCVRTRPVPGVILVPVAVPVPAWGTPPPRGGASAVPAAVIPLEEAARLLRLAEAAIRAVEGAAAKGAAPGASAAEKAAAEAVGNCMEALTGAIGPAAALVEQLRKAVDAGRGAAVTRAQVMAVEAFTDCVAKAEKAKETPRIWDTLVGIGLPTAGALAVAL